MSVRKSSGITLKGLNISRSAGKLVRRKVDVRTVCIALEVDADASEKMHQTRRLYGQACNLLVPIVVSDTDRNGSGNGTTCTRPLIRWFEPKCPFLVHSSPATSYVRCRACTSRGSAAIRTSRRIRRWCSRASASGILLFIWTRTPFASSTTTPRRRSIR